MGVYKGGLTAASSRAAVPATLKLLGAPDGPARRLGESPRNDALHGYSPTLRDWTTGTGKTMKIRVTSALGQARECGISRRTAWGCAAAMLLAAPASAEDAKWPSSVSSRYTLSFNGFEVGAYSFESTSNGKTYSATSSANVSALFGAFKWKGTINASGAITPEKPRPVSYEMSFRTKSKEGLIRLGFDKAGVKSVAIEPKKEPNPEAVPVKPEHMKSVFDPMSAIMALTHAGAGNPCSKKLAVFDGKVRFNLTLSPKGHERLTETIPSGQPKELHICQVKYDPVSGHKPKDFADPWVDYGAIEIALRPVPSAGVYVPYRITVPTTLGAAVMVADRIDITAPNNTVIALTQ